MPPKLATPGLTREINRGSTRCAARIAPSRFHRRLPMVAEPPGASSCLAGSAGNASALSRAMPRSTRSPGRSARCAGPPSVGHGRSTAALSGMSRNRICAAPRHMRQLVRLGGSGRSSRRDQARIVPRYLSAVLRIALTSARSRMSARGVGMAMVVVGKTVEQRAGIDDSGNSLPPPGALQVREHRRRYPQHQRRWRRDPACACHAVWSRRSRPGALAAAWAGRIATPWVGFPPPPGSCAGRAAVARDPASYVAASAAISTRVRFSVLGWVEQIVMRSPDSGLMMKRYAVAGLRSASGLWIRSAVGRSCQPKPGPALAQISAPRRSAEYSRVRLIAICTAAASGATSSQPERR